MTNYICTIIAGALLPREQTQIFRSKQLTLNEALISITKLPIVQQRYNRVIHRMIGNDIVEWDIKIHDADEYTLYVRVFYPFPQVLCLEQLWVPIVYITKMERVNLRRHYLKYRSQFLQKNLEPFQYCEVTIDADAKHIEGQS